MSLIQFLKLRRTANYWLAAYLSIACRKGWGITIRSELSRVNQPSGQGHIGKSIGRGKFLSTKLMFLFANVISLSANLVALPAK